MFLALDISYNGKHSEVEHLSQEIVQIVKNGNGAFVALTKYLHFSLSMLNTHFNRERSLQSGLSMHPLITVSS